MTWILVLFLLALFVGAAVALSQADRRKEARRDAYRLIKPLSEPEQTLYWRLREAMPECIVLSQVTFSRFIAPKGANRTHRQVLFNRISRKSADFLLCLKDFTVVAAIELDDRSHSAKNDAARDAILKNAGVSVLRFQVKDIPSADQLRALFTT